MGVELELPLTSHPRWRRAGVALARFLEPVVILAALLTIPLTIVAFSGQTDAGLQTFNWGIWVIFLVDYLLGLAVADNRLKYLTGGYAILGLLVVLVSFPLWSNLLAITRLFRLARIFQLSRIIIVSGRAFPSLQQTLRRQGLLYVVCLLIFLVTTAGAVMTLVEPQTVKGDIWSGIWWALVTVTTVGYGDISPATPWGRLIAAILMFSGIGLTATLAASVAAFFIGRSDEKVDDGLITRLDRMEKLLLDLKTQGMDGQTPVAGE